MKTSPTNRRLTLKVYGPNDYSMEAHYQNVGSAIALAKKEISWAGHQGTLAEIWRNSSSKGNVEILVTLVNKGSDRIEVTITDLEWFKELGGRI